MLIVTCAPGTPSVRASRALACAVLAALAKWRELVGFAVVSERQPILMERGCQIIAEQSGHVVAIDQPPVVVDAIRAIVDAARGRNDVPLCGSRVAAQ